MNYQNDCRAIEEKLRFRITFACYLALSTLVISGAFAQSSAAVDSFYAPSLGRVKKFTYILPTSYTKSKQYPILYLLHGYSDDYSGWNRRTKIAEYASAYALIVVMPDGENSWYVNAVGDPSARFEDYLTRDLPTHIQQHFSVDTTRQAIAGLSMGGNGSLVLAMRHPTQYRFAGSLSGAISVPHYMDDTSRQARKYLGASLIRAYGEKPSQFRKDHDVFHLSKQLSKGSSPYFYLVIGIQDQYLDFVPSHHDLIKTLRSRKISYEYHEMQGDHSWPFWDREIQPLLKRMREVMGF
jgi:S-formylglutathione hydrolase FrmB